MRINHVDRAIEQLKGERAVLDLAIAKLEAQRTSTVKQEWQGKKPSPKKSKKADKGLNAGKFGAPDNGE